MLITHVKRHDTRVFKGCFRLLIVITNFSIPSTFPWPSGGYEKGDNLIFTIYDEDRPDRLVDLKESLLNDPKKRVFQKSQPGLVIIESLDHLRD